MFWLFYGGDPSILSGHTIGGSVTVCHSESNNCKFSASAALQLMTIHVVQPLSFERQFVTLQLHKAAHCPCLKKIIGDMNVTYETLRITFHHKWSLSTLYNWYVTCLGFCCCLARLCLFHWSLWHSLHDHHRWHHLGPPLLINISPVMTPMWRQSSCLWHLPHITIIIIMNKHKPSNCISHVSPVIIVIIFIELSSSSWW